MKHYYTLRKSNGKLKLQELYFYKLGCVLGWVLIISVLLDNFDLATKLVYGAISLLRETYINDETKLD